MVPRTDIKENEDSVVFYDSLAGEYNDLTGFTERFDKESPIFEALVKKYDMKIVLDAGCGTGFHSILLAQLGLKVTATDISTQMLLQAKQNAEIMNVQFETIQTSFQDVDKNVHNKFDSIFCLGNTLPHLLTEDELYQSLKGFHRILKSGGRMILQLLNYNRILNLRERILNIKEVNDKIFVRFYDYGINDIVFNILTVQRSGGQIEHSLKSVRLIPWRSADLIRILKSVGYDNIQIYGNMFLNDYDEYSSKDLVVLTQK